MTNALYRATFPVSSLAMFTIFLTMLCSPNSRLNVEYMREVVGYECKELKPSESEERARELEKGLKRLYEKHKVST